jgi:hypothetical protein
MSDGTCDYDRPPHPRNWILTRLDPPQTIELCDDHLAIGLVYLTAADLGIDADAFYAAVEKIVKREAAKADKALADAQALPADPAPDGTRDMSGYETFPDLGRDLRAERKAGIGEDEPEPAS